MIVIGLTGSIAMGKTTVARQFAALGAEVFFADLAVHRMLEEDGAAVEAVAKLFPGTKESGHISRRKLGQQVFGNEKALAKLEAVLHPLVREEQVQFVREQECRGTAVAVLDIPLLFETGFDSACDCTVTVTAPRFLQRFRALRRMHMSEARLRAVEKRQLPDAEKRRRADFVVHTGLGRAYSLRQVKTIMRLIQ